jgi:uncharacterized protein YdaU (DUF1376 family)
MDNLKYFPLYFNRFMDGVRGYDAEFIGIYIMLLCRQAETHRIPKDLEKLGRWMGGVEAVKIEKVLSEKFLCDDHGFFNVVMVEVLEEVAKKSASARKSANDRWERIRLECERNANASETHPKTDANGMLIKESKEKERKGKEGLVNKFTPPELLEVIDYFFLKESNKDDAEKFHDHFTSNGWLVSGKAKMKDWQASARNWIKNSKKWNQNNGKPSRQPATLSDYENKYSGLFQKK